MKNYLLAAFCVAICVFLPALGYAGSLRFAIALAFLASVVVLAAIFFFRALLWVLKNGRTSPLVIAHDSSTGETRVMSEIEAGSRMTILD